MVVTLRQLSGIAQNANLQPIVRFDLLIKTLIITIKKVMHKFDIQYLRNIISRPNTSIMHNLKLNFDRFFNITKSVFKYHINSFDDFFPYWNMTKLSDYQIIAFSVAGESLGIDGESFLWEKLKSEHSQDFPNLIERSNYNCRRKRLYPFIEKLNKSIVGIVNQREDCFLVDSIPSPVCKNARENRSKVCKEIYETAPNKGYSAVNKTWLFGYKLRQLTSVRGVFHSMDLTKASVHYVHCLSQVKYTGLNNCLLLADKGCLSGSQQLDMFSSCNIKLETLMCSNQKNYTLYPPVSKKVRKIVETLFSQLCDRFMLKCNYTKTIKGLSVRILTKVTSVTLLQYINLKNGKPINNLKYALAN